MFRTLLEEFVIPLLLFLLVRSLLRGWFSASRRTPAPRRPEEPTPYRPRGSAVRCPGWARFGWWPCGNRLPPGPAAEPLSDKQLARECAQKSGTIYLMI